MPDLNAVMKFSPLTSSTHGSEKPVFKNPNPLGFGGFVEFYLGFIGVFGFFI